MRFFAGVAAVALFATASADQTGETQADNYNSGNVRVLTSDSVTVTVTDADCSGGKCKLLQRQSPSTTRDALTVLSNALDTPTVPSPSNALVVLSEAGGSFAIPVIPLTFSPELYSSYGLSGVSSVQSSSENTAAAPTASAPPATYATTAPEVTSSIVATTSTAIVVPIPTTDTTAASMPATTTDTTVIPANPSTLSTVPSGESTASLASSPAETGGATTISDVSIVSPIGGGSSTTMPADTTGGPESTGGNGGTSTQTGVTANPEQTSGTETGPVPTATGFGIKNQPAAYGGLVAAVGAVLFI